MQLAAAAREPAEPAVELQQQREAKLGVVVLRGHQVMLSPDQRPVLDQVTKLKRERSTSAHLRGERHDQATETGQPQPKCNLSLKWPLVTAFLSTPELAARAARQGSNEDGLGRTGWDSRST